MLPVTFFRKEASFNKQASNSKQVITLAKSSVLAVTRDLEFFSVTLVSRAQVIARAEAVSQSYASLLYYTIFLRAFFKYSLPTSNSRLISRDVSLDCRLGTVGYAWYSHGRRSLSCGGGGGGRIKLEEKMKDIP